MFFSDNGEKPLRRDQSFRPMPGMLQHRSLTDEVDVLFGQVIAPSLMDKLSQSRSISG
jgi:hypothetical protein